MSEEPPVFDDEERAPAAADRDRQYQLGRLMAFSDGVLAIAITLLVLNVAVPDIARAEAQSRLPAALLDTGPRLLTFALSFFLVGLYWIRHHQLFRQLSDVDVWLLWLNLVVLFLVCLLPFSSGVVGRYFDTVIGAEVYAVNLAAIGVSFSLLYLYAARDLMAHPPPGAVRGLVSQGFLWPLVVVALVMVLAPIKLLAAYVIGTSLMLAVGVYTALPRSLQSAPLRGTSDGHLKISPAAAQTTISGQPAMRELFRARFTGSEPTLNVRANTVDVAYPAVSIPRMRKQSAEVKLNTTIPWRIEVAAGMVWLKADLTQLQVTAVTVDGGNSVVELRLPRPSGTVPIHIRGSASEVRVLRAAAVPVRAVARGGFSALHLDGREVDDIGGGAQIETPDYSEAADRYDLDFSGGTANLTVGRL